MPHPMEKRVLSLLALTFLSVHIGVFAYSDYEELHEDSSPKIVDINFKDVSKSDTMNNKKRSWKSLQGSWGKRINNEAIINDFNSEQYEYLMKQPENNNESNSNSETKSGDINHYVLYKSIPNVLGFNIGASAAIDEFKNLEMANSIFSNFEKRNWKNMNVAWGKRRSAVWNKFRGAWGKREPAWNNLKGMWGKRSANDWKKLQSAWGKRSQ